MSPNNNFNILAWYDSIEQQNHRKAYVYGTIWGLIAPNNSILPFQFVSPGSLGNVISVVVKSLETSWSVDITSKITVSVTNYTDDDGNEYSIVMHKGDDTLSSKLPEGRHYIILEQGSKTWYSEVFTVVSNIDCFIKLEYWDNSNLYFKGGHIEYLTGFKFVCYLSTDIGKPKYPFEEELTERDGYKFIEKQTSSKVYNMTFCAPEFMCDALRLVRMCDNIHITNQGKVYRALSFSVNVDWEDNGDVAAVDAEFETDTVVTKIANVLNGPSESGSTFNDALLYEKSSPLMFDEGVVAQYTRTVQVTVEAQFVGKLIRELDEYLSEQIPETAYIAIDLGDGPALKFPLSKLSDKYWNYVSDVAEDYLIPKVAKHIFSNKDVVAYATGKYDIVLPVASVSALGAIKVGDGLTIASDGTLSATGSGSIAGITISPNTGNVLTGATLSADGKTITFAKDLTAITTANYTTTLDTRYVKKSGDTMTGALVLPAGSASATDKGLRFPVGSTNYTALRYNGSDALVISGAKVDDTIYIRPNGTSSTTGEATLDKSGNFATAGEVIAYSTGSGDITLPVASPSALGAIKVGKGLSIDSNGVLSATGAGSIAGIITSPNTGNVLTGATLSTDGKTITFTKDLTALTTTNYSFTLDTRYVKKSGDTMTGALTATRFVSNIATGTSPLSIASTTLCTNLNADMLDGYHAGVQNGQVAIYVPFPGYKMLVDLGYNTEANATNAEEFLKGICKWAIDNYAGNGQCTLIGTARPNSSGTLILHLYSNDSKDSTTGLPKYCEGVFFKMPGVAYTFGTNEYVWKWSHSTWSGNALTATKLQTAITLWGQSFDGSAPVSGNMTGVGSIDASGTIKTSADIIAYSTGSGDISLPIASASALGVVKVGSGLTIASDGTLSATDSGSIAGIITSPNTGNVLTGATLSTDGKTITFTKDLTALTTTNYSSTLDTRYVKKSGDTMTGALTATRFVSNIATGTSPLSIASTTLCANLNADLLDGKHAGVQNGQVAIYVPFPGYKTLVNLGYNTEANATNNEEYLKGICKWAIDNYAGNGNCTLIGVGSPNGSGTLILHLYSNDSKDSTTGLPKYCEGVLFHLNGSARTFGTNEYVWKWSHSTWSGNALTATKLQTAITLWGQLFDGSAHISGDMTGVGSITASGTIKTSADIIAYSTGSGDISLPIASASALGAIKVGNGLSIASDGTLSATGAGSIGSVTVNGSGNAITAASASGTILTLTKGLTFWHAGNDGSGSGLDADMLDGKHNGEVTAALLKTIDTRSVSETPDSLKQGVESYFKSISTVGLTGGRYAGLLSFRPWSDFSGGPAYQMAFTESPNLHIRQGTADRWGSWNQVAYTTSNVASATNADKLDGIHASDLFTSLSNIGNNLSVTIGGTTKTLTVGYASNSDMLDGYHAGSFMRFNNDTNYVSARFIDSDTAIKAYEKYIEWWQNNSGWFNFRIGSLVTNGAIQSTSTITASGTIKSTSDVIAYSTGSGDIVLPIASASALGAIKVGSGLSIDSSGVLSATGTGSVGNIVISPNTGNVITNATLSTNGRTITFAKDLTAWHAGNDGSGSGLDADLLDGLQATAFARTDQSPAVDLDTVNGFGIMCNPYNSNATAERNYPIAEAGILIYGPAAYSSGNQIYGSYLSNRWFARGGGNSTMTKTTWKEFAFKTDNVASATKLQTAMAIWGQNFDGTVPVSGNMTGVGSITASGQITTSIATGTKPINVISTTLCANLNADLLDGKHAGVQNGQVAVYVPFPGYKTLVNLGYNTEANATNNEEYLKGICKWAIDNYAGNGQCTLIGVGSPNGSGTLILHLYSNQGKDSTTGLPRYCEGVLFHLNGSARTFGTNEYVWKWSHSTWSGNALTATKLQTARAIWGQLFDGSVPISGDMIGVGSITMSGQLNAASLSGSWIYGKTNGVISLESTSSSTSTYFPLYRWKTYTGRVFNLGGLQTTDTEHTFGFYMFDKDRTKNGTDAGFYMNAYGNMKGTGDLAMNGDVIAYSTGAATAPFKYWRPYVSTDGVISWSNTTSDSNIDQVDLATPAAKKAATLITAKSVSGTDISTNGTPRVDVSASNGELSFTFHQLKGATGAPAKITNASASISGGYGTPGVNVTLGGSDTARTFAFAFSNLRGATGANGIFSKVIYYGTKNSSTGATEYTTNAVIKCGISTFTGSISSGSQANMGSITITNVLSISTTMYYSGTSISENMGARKLHVVTNLRPSNVWQFQLCNDTGSTISVSSGVVAVYWTAICSS